MATSFSTIYDRFFGKITDDMYMEWSKEDTERDVQNILVDAIPGFEFPNFPLYDYELGVGTEDDEIINLDDLDIAEDQAGHFSADLTNEEINILAILMYNTWLQRQVASIENTRMKYSGTDFKFTSQANHLDKLIKLKQEAERQDRHAQRLYHRHKLIDSKGSIKSNWSTVMERSVFDDD